MQMVIFTMQRYAFFHLSILVFLKYAHTILTYFASPLIISPVPSL